MKKKENLEKAIKMAMESIYHGAKYLGEWNGYAIYEPIFNDDEVRFLGLPQYILEKDGVLRWTEDSDESLSIMHAL